MAIFATMSPSTIETLPRHAGLSLVGHARSLAPLVATLATISIYSHRARKGVYLGPAIIAAKVACAMYLSETHFHNQEAYERFIRSVKMLALISELYKRNVKKVPPMARLMLLPSIEEWLLRKVVHRQIKASMERVVPRPIAVAAAIGTTAAVRGAVPLLLHIGVDASETYRLSCFALLEAILTGCIAEKYGVKGAIGARLTNNAMAWGLEHLSVYIRGIPS